MIVSEPQYYTPQLNGGLNRGRLWNWINKHKFQLLSIISGSATGVLTGVIGIIVDQFEKDVPPSSTSRLANVPDPTTAEDIIIEKWINTRLAPFYISLIKKLDTALKLNDFNIQLSEINNVLIKIAYIKQYYLTNETTGLSSNAIQHRIALIEAGFQPLQLTIDKIIVGNKSKLNFIRATDYLNGQIKNELQSVAPGLVANQKVDYQKYIIAVATTAPQKPLTTDNIVTNTDGIIPQLPVRSNYTWLWVSGAIAAIIAFWPHKKTE